MMSNEMVEQLPWVLAEVKDEDFPVFFRFLRDVPKIRTSDYRCMISIFWSYPVTDNSGFPSEEINQAHLDIEEALNSLDDHEDSFYVAQITGNGRKEWIWYTKDVDIWWNKFIKALKRHPKYPLEIETSEEKDWETYRIISKNTLER